MNWNALTDLAHVVGTVVLAVVVLRVEARVRALELQATPLPEDDD